MVKSQKSRLGDVKTWRCEDVKSRPGRARVNKFGDIKVASFRLCQYPAYLESVCGHIRIEVWRTWGTISQRIMKVSHVVHESVWTNLWVSLSFGLEKAFSLKMSINLFLSPNPNRTLCIADRREADCEKVSRGQRGITPLVMQGASPLARWKLTNLRANRTPNRSNVALLRFGRQSGERLL